MKDDEKELLIAIYNRAAYESVREVIDRLDINHKRAWYLLGKFEARGWYNSGVTHDLGWLTEEGKEAARKAPEEV
jgi:hypothetical protein